mmetsp:Transcript_46733/g.123509  ORF Transcript_46733/g.123509 Transcript_46733/m.123509 type:complete len:205 (-) Transcript_46733:270-884(-)
MASRLRHILRHKPGGSQSRDPKIIQRHVAIPDKVLPEDPLRHHDAQRHGDHLSRTQEPVPHAALPEERAVVLEHEDQLADLHTVPLHRDLVPSPVRSQQRNGHKNQRSRFADVLEQLPHRGVIQGSGSVGSICLVAQPENDDGGETERRQHWAAGPVRLRKHDGEVPGLHDSDEPGEGDHIRGDSFWDEPGEPLEDGTCAIVDD